ncbi:MAG: FAD-dependent oxidoreductase [Sphingobacteriales bacterium]|nr:MAG: FAD-dependent oxidoreductase [Sphingobacteriales bacterium]
MKRDGNLVSLWQNTVDEFQPTNSWNKDETYDVLIVGGGITGLTTALLLQTEGKKCILAEAYNIGFGTTGGTTAHLNTILDTPYNVIARNFDEETTKVVAGASREAIDLIEGLVNKYNIDCDFSYQPAFLYAETDEEEKELEKLERAAVTAGVATSCSDSLPIAFKFKKICRFDMQAQIHPTKYIRGLAKAFEENGGVILQNCIVDTVSGKEPIQAETALGTITANYLVYATHIPPGINLLHFRCAPYRSYAMAFTLKSGKYPTGLVYDMKDPYNYFRTHTIDGVEYVIAGGFDHKTGHKKNTGESFRELEAYVRKQFDIDTVAHKWSSQYFTSTDGLPYIGKLPGHENIYTGTGFSGNGLIFGSLTGKIICEMLTNGESRYEKVFSPSRIKPIAGFAEFVKENLDVVSQFVRKRMSYEKIEALVELAPGEATLAEWEGKKVALYKDENGKVHALDPVCPHAKCVVEWNSAEKSWDCPCHGGRYAPNGALLTGPATRGLTQIIWEDIEGD